MTNRLFDPQIIDQSALARAPDLLTAETIAPLLNVSRSTIYSLMRSEQLSIIRVGKRKYVRKESFTAWLNSYSLEAKS